MPAAPLPPDETARLALLRSLEVLDTEPEQFYDDAVRLAAHLCGTPISAVSLIDEHRQWFKARVGLEPQETPREVAFCAHAILQDEVFEVQDATSDERFATNPLVTADPEIRFYAGAPLRADGRNIGTLCVIDREPRALTTDQREALATLGRTVAMQLALRLRLKAAADAERVSSEARQELETSQQLLTALTRVQTEYLLTQEPAIAFERLLESTLRLTGSEYGFIGEIIQRDGAPILKTLALTDISWSQETRRLYVEHAAAGLEFTNMKTLFGAAILTGEPVIANDAPLDPRSGLTMPPGHPPLNSFLGLPFFTGTKLTGLIGLANRSAGFDESLVKLLEPLATTCGSLIGRHRAEKERVRVDSELRETSSRLTALMRNLRAGLLVEDEHRRIQLANDELCRMFAIPASPDQLVGLDCAGAAKEFAAQFENPQRFLEEIETTLQRRDLVLAQELRMADGRILERDYLPVFISEAYRGHLWQYRDVTDRKRAETELIARGNELSEANADLARASRLKDEFLASMSHELRTPLNAVLGLSEALCLGAYGNLSQEQIETVGVIEDSGRHLLQLINDILDLSKIEAGRMVLSASEVDVENLCSASVRLIREAAHRKGISVTVSVGPGCRSIEADPLRLKQVLVNLLSNAVKFTPEGGSIGLEVRGDERSELLQIVVWDTGIGISDDDVPKLFQPFMQLDSSLSRRQYGTGLGLSLVRRLVDLHGGEVSAKSQPGKGSRFTVTLPFAADSRKAVPAEAERGNEPDPALGTADSRPLVLLAEDNEFNIVTFRKFLEMNGYRLAIARNGEEAVRRAVKEMPSVILMDVQMPVKDGLTAIAEIRRNEKARHIPIIALTALAMPDDRERCLAAGADAYLSKPVGLRSLAEAIERELQRGRQQ